MVSETYVSTTVVGPDGLPYVHFAKKQDIKKVTSMAKAAGIPNEFMREFSRWFHEYKRDAFGRQNLGDEAITEIIDAFKRFKGLR